MNKLKQISESVNPEVVKTVTASISAVLRAYKVKGKVLPPSVNNIFTVVIEESPVGLIESSYWKVNKSQVKDIIDVIRDKDLEQLPGKPYDAYINESDLSKEGFRLFETVYKNVNPYDVQLTVSDRYVDKNSPRSKAITQKQNAEKAMKKLREKLAKFVPDSWAKVVGNFVSTKVDYLGNWTGTFNLHLRFNDKAAAIRFMNNYKNGFKITSNWKADVTDFFDDIADLTTKRDSVDKMDELATFRQVIKDWKPFEKAVGEVIDSKEQYFGNSDFMKPDIILTFWN